MEEIDSNVPKIIDDSQKIFVPDLELSLIEEVEEIDSNVQKIINDSRKIFLTDLELNQSIEMEKENKENIVIPAKKTAWKPIMGAKTLRRKKLSSRSNSIVTDDQEIDLPEYEKIRLKNIAEKESLLNKVKKSALAIKPKAK